MTAAMYWGGSWRMPTKDDFDELIANCICQKKTNGYLLMSKMNYKTVFFPFAGVYDGNACTGNGSKAFYFSSTLNSESQDSSYVFYLDGNGDTKICKMISNGTRQAGHSIRPVRSKIN